MQFDWFLSVLEQKWLENLDIYSIGAAELPLEFPNCTPLPKGDGDTSSLVVPLVLLNFNIYYLPLSMINTFPDFPLS